MIGQEEYIPNNIDPIIPLHKQYGFTSALYDRFTDHYNTCWVYCHTCSCCEMLDPFEIEQRKIRLILPQNPRRDFKEVVKCDECVKNNKINQWVRSIGDIPDELRNLTKAEVTCLSPIAPVVQYCINRNG